MIAVILLISALPITTVAAETTTRSPSPTLECSSEAVTRAQTLKLSMSENHGGYLTIRRPDNISLFLVYPDPKSDQYRLMSPSEFTKLVELDLPVDSADAQVWYSGRGKERVFTISGVYEVTVADNLGTDVPSGRTTCRVLYTPTPRHRPAHSVWDQSLSDAYAKLNEIQETFASTQYHDDGVIVQRVWLEDVNGNGVLEVLHGESPPIGPEVDVWSADGLLWIEVYRWNGTRYVAATPDYGNFLGTRSWKHCMFLPHLGKRGGRYVLAVEEYIRQIALIRGGKVTCQFMRTR